MMHTVYVASPESQHIYVWRLNSIKPQLKLIQIIDTPGNVQPIVIHPNQQFLYAGMRPNFGIITYSINQKGLLNETQITLIKHSPTYLTINEKGTFLYCVSYNANSMSVISINTLGIPNDIVQIITQLPGCHSANFSHNQQLLWVPCLLDHSIKIFQVHTSQGILTLSNLDNCVRDIISSPRHMVFNQLNNYAYVINELTGTVDVIQYNHNKMQQPLIIQTISIAPFYNGQRLWASDIHITPNNYWLFCTDRLLNIITCFQVLPNNKKLKFLYYKYTEKQPRGFAIDKKGQFLIIAGQKSNYIALYKINLENGKLHLISRYSSGIGPMWIEILPYI